MIEKAEITVATKSLVDRLLAINTSNRRLKPTVVSRYAEAIRKGEWMLTNQGIGVSDSGVLIDGQHRLEAIKEAGYPPVQLLIVYGLSSKSQICVDNHAKRSMCDALKVCFNEEFNSRVPAICKMILAWRHCVSGRFTVTSPTPNEVIDCYIENKDFISSVLSCPQKKAFWSIGYYSAFTYGVKHYGEDAVFDLMRQAEDGVKSNGSGLTKDMPSFHLRTYRMSSVNKKNCGGAGMAENLRKTLSAVISHCEGHPMKLLKDRFFDCSF